MYDYCVRFHLPKSQYLIFCTGQFSPITASWVCFQLLWWCTFLGTDRSALAGSSSGLSPRRLSGVKEDGLSSLLAFSSSSSESFRKDGVDAERTTPVKHKLFPIARNRSGVAILLSSVERCAALLASFGMVLHSTHPLGGGVALSSSLWVVLPSSGLAFRLASPSFGEMRSAFCVVPSLPSWCWGDQLLE